MPRSSDRRAVRLTSRVLLGAVLLAGTLACGADEEEPTPVSEETRACRAQWGDVAQTILDMDRDTHPSALPQRWSTIIAGVDYQQRFANGEGCVEAIEDQVGDIDALRKLGQRLQVYDMEYQLHAIRPRAELYLSEQVPPPYRNDNGRPVRPPAKAAVAAALQTLEETAAASNAELQPGWQQANAVDLGSPDSVRAVIQDLDRLATSSPAFQRCQQALQVLAAAAQAQTEAQG